MSEIFKVKIVKDGTNTVIDKVHISAIKYAVENRMDDKSVNHIEIRRNKT